MPISSNGHLLNDNCVKLNFKLQIISTPVHFSYNTYIKGIANHLNNLQIYLKVGFVPLPLQLAYYLSVCG